LILKGAIYPTLFDSSIDDQQRPCDISDPKQVILALATSKPDVVVNVARILKLDYCEMHPVEAVRMNSVGAGIVAMAAQAQGARLVHVSTDHVFSGMDGPYSIDDEPYPINSYGYTMLLGERAVTNLHAKPVIVRIGWMYGHEDPTCAPMRALNETYSDGVMTKHAYITNDTQGTPTWIGHVQHSLMRVMVMKPAEKLIHVGPKETPVSWFDFLLPEFPGIRWTPTTQGQAKHPRKGGLVPSKEWATPGYEAGLERFLKEANDAVR
jgi:dTDP-4-dehydrorhamnose reductase